jgi:hypothetical protein
MHCTRAIPSAWSCSRWGLPSQPVARLLVSAYLTISPLPGTLAWRYVSVALSLRSLSLAVNQHPALWSSDFPRTVISMIRDCLSSSNPPQKSSISCPPRPVQKTGLFSWTSQQGALRTEEKRVTMAIEYENRRSFEDSPNEAEMLLEVY